MSFASVPVNLPDPFSITPHLATVPLTKTFHVSGVQVLTGTTTTLGGSQLVAPLILNIATGGTGAYTLPGAYALANAFGSANQVQVGDLFVVPVFSLNAGTGGFFADPSSGAGSTFIAPYVAPLKQSALSIQFTQAGPGLFATGSYFYTLQ